MGDRNYKEEKEEIETQSQETDKDPVAFAEFTSNNGWDEYQIDNFSVKASWEVFEIKNTANVSEDDPIGHKVKLKTRTEELSQNPGV